MASMSPETAQDERLLDQLSALSKNTENPMPEPIESEGFYSRSVIKALDSIPVTRHGKKEEKIIMNNGYQKTFTRFRKSMMNRVERFRKSQEDDIPETDTGEEFLAIINQNS